MLLAPRWEAAGVSEASATVKYEASGGYVSYQYRLNADKNSLQLTFTGPALHTDLELLLPKGRNVKTVLLNNKQIPFKSKQVEQSRYITLQVAGIAVHQLKIQLA